VSVGNERDLAQDASFGVRQLADIALRAISPGINDPTTAVTCIGYIRSILERLASRRFPSEVRRLERGSMTLVARRVEYREYLDTLAEIGRHARGDIRIVRQLIRACAGVSEIALAAGTPERVAETDGVAAGIVEQALAEVRSPRERELIEELAARQSLRIAASRASASA
jgi:uncharacterized membrane protein